MKKETIFLSKISVKFDEVVPHLDQNFNKGQTYAYSELSNFLEENFPGINSNQIAGLISRMGQSEVFKKEKIPGQRIKYVYQGQYSNDNAVKTKVANQLKTTLIDLNKLKLNVTKPDDFSWLQKQINTLEKQINNLEE